MTRPDDTLEDAILAGVDGRLFDVHTQLRGNVVSYDEATHTCEVALGTKVALPDGEGGFVYQALPNLTHVPVAWPSAGGFILHWPLPAGSAVFVTFDEQDSQKWEASGQVSEPGWLERFGLSSALAHPYSRTAIETSGACMACPSPFSFGDPATAQPVASATLVAAELAKIAAVLLTNAGAPLTYSPATVAATKLKAE